MNATLPRSIEHVVAVEVLRGEEAAQDAALDLLVEVPHGADERWHYDALRTRLKGALPEDLHEFFSVNTDVGAYAYGRRVAELVLKSAPTRSALVLRSLIPRTFVDCNRPADFSGAGTLGKGGMTPGIPPYVRDERDLALLLELHGQYVEVARAAYERVCGNGGVALLPHTYGPRSLGIDAVDDDIVKKLRWACAPERHDTWPLRAEIDLLTRDGESKELSPPGAEERLLRAFAASGFQCKANDTYYLHPSSLGHRWAAAYPGRTLSLEVRRDLLVERWDPLAAMNLAPAGVERVAAVLAPVLVDQLAGAERAALAPADA